jgi:acyl carrier protein
MTAPPGDRVMTADEFRAYLAVELRVPVEQLADGATFAGDLGFDSIQMFELLLAVEDLGVELPEALLPHIEAVADAFHYYETQQGHRTTG